MCYRQLLEWFFKFYDPTQLNRQDPDVGTQYRSAVFVAETAQLDQAKAYLVELQESKRFRNRRIVTQVESAGLLCEVEECHQECHGEHGGPCPLP